MTQNEDCATNPDQASTCRAISTPSTLWLQSPAKHGNPLISSWRPHLYENHPLRNENHFPRRSSRQVSELLGTLFGGWKIWDDECKQNKRPAKMSIVKVPFSSCSSRVASMPKTRRSRTVRMPNLKIVDAGIRREKVCGCGMWI